MKWLRPPRNRSSSQRVWSDKPKVNLSPTIAPTSAECAAESNWRANRTLLQRMQPVLVELLDAVKPTVLWLYGRDKSLTAMDAAGQWFAACSLPRLAGEAMLKTLEAKSTVMCFLAPPHAGAVRAAFEHLKPQQALLLIVPDARITRMMLHCDDFSQEISDGRLWFAAGEMWASMLAALLNAHAGLPTPGQFIRLPSTDAQQTDPLIATAQKIFSDTLASRAQQISQLRQNQLQHHHQTRQRPVGRLCLLGARHFRLWDDAAYTLAQAVSQELPPGIECEVLHTDEPLNASPLAIAQSAARADAVIAANVARADLPDLLPECQPWITWITRADEVPAYVPSAPADGLLLADPRWRGRAISLGWPAHRLSAAPWPTLGFVPAEDNEPDNPGLAGAPFIALIMDTVSLAAPERIAEFSSHQLLWETIRGELNDPFAIGLDPDAYLKSRMKRYDVSEDGLDQALFREGLIFPAYAQALARLLLRHRLPLRLFGQGWETLPEFAPHAHGPVRSRAALAQVLHAAAGLVRPWPLEDAHPTDSAGKFLIRGQTVESFLLSARTALVQCGISPSPPAAVCDNPFLRLLMPNC